MACYHPLRAYRGVDGSVFFGSERRGREASHEIELPCGRCVGCRLERSRQWAVRCMHEAQLHEENSYVTFTYEINPVSLVYRDFQLFMKRLRSECGAVRFFMCGEYGELDRRPHYHALLFGYRPKDLLYFATKNGFKLYTSAQLTRIWGLGHCVIGNVSFESAAYVARYIMKKVTGDAASDHYKVVDKLSGEVLDIVPEFCNMSRRPGIGAAWVDKFRSDIYPKDYCVVNGNKSVLPRFYDKRLEKIDPDGFELLKFERAERAKVLAADNSYERLAVKEVVTTARVGHLKRDL